jgi:MoxR-like ATPase
VNDALPFQKIAEDAGETGRLIQQSLAEILVDMESVIEQVTVAVFAGGHVLLEGVPGTAKTTLCRNLAGVLGLEFRRIQFTPDLLPTDVTGTRILDRATSRFVLQKGPVFCQLLLADELNRAPARTQSALLEAMQERQVTIEGETLPLPRPFIVLATQNPVEQEGVYRLPEAQLDRFIFRVRVGYPDRDQEIGLLDKPMIHATPVTQMCSADKVLRFQGHVDSVYCSVELREYVVDLIRRSREHDDVLLGGSPRAGMYLLRAARARALVRGQSFCTHTDIQAVLAPVLEHRLIIRPESELAGGTVTRVIADILRSVPIREAPDARGRI